MFTLHVLCNIKPAKTGEWGSELQLAACNGATAWRLNCPGMQCSITSPHQDTIAVWGDHEPIWTGTGGEGAHILVTSNVLYYCFDTQA